MLKLDPKNTELLAQKQTVLKENIAQTSEKLKSLKNVQEQVYTKWQNYIKLKPKIDEIANSISKTETQLKGLKKEQEQAQKQFEKGKITKEQFEQINSKVKECSNSLATLKKEQEELNKITVSTESYRNYQREVIKTTAELKQFNLEASKWTQASSKLSDLSSKMNSFGNVVSSVGKKVSVLSAGIASLFGAGVKYNADIETYTTAFKTFLGNVDKATEAVEEIRKQSEESPFDTKELIQANQMLITTGESAENSRKTISALADAIALTGGGNDALSRMASNLQQIKNAGKATSMDIRQFAYAGIDVYGILSETTGKTIQEVKEMDVTYEQLSNALIKASSEGGKYYNGQAEMANTLNGQISKLKKTFQDLLGELSKSLMPTISKITSKLQDFVNWFKNLDDNQKNMITKIGLIISAVGPFLLILGKMITLGGSFFGVLSKVASIIAKVSTGTGALSGVLTALSGPIGIVIAAVLGAVAAFTLLWNKSETFRNSLAEIGQSIINTYNEHIKPTIDNIKEILLMLWNDVLKPLLSFLWDVFSPIIEKVFVIAGQVIANVFDKVSIIIQGITGVLKGLIKFITGVFTGDWEKAWEGIKDIFGSVFNGLKALFKAPINWIISGINKFIGGINKIKIPDWVPGVGGKGINIPVIPQLAKGGIVNKATLAMIGEGKSAEAVIPLDRTLTKYMAEAMKQAGGNTNNITVNFYPKQMTEAELDKAFDYIDRKFGMAY